MEKIYLIVEYDNKLKKEFIKGFCISYVHAKKITSAFQNASNEQFDYYVQTYVKSNLL